VAGRRRPGAAPRPPRSQNFLRSAALAAELVRDAEVERDDLVLDLGAGKGRLTEALSRVVARVVAIEVDPALAHSLEGRWDNVRVVVADAAEVALPDEPFRVVANLPFLRTTDLLHRLLDPRGKLVRADLIVEWDVAVKRAVPWPSTLNGVYWSAFYEASLARRLPRTAFVPMPGVDAGVLTFRRRERPLVSPSRAQEYRQFVSSGFRSGLGHLARTHGLDIGRKRAARDVDAHEWAGLFESVFPRS